MSLSRIEIDQFLQYSTGNICDANDKKGNMDHQIKPLSPHSRMAGFAMTVACFPGDNLTIHKAISAAPEGAVLVINARGYSAGHLGELMVLACIQRGLAGIVIDGGCRDSADIIELGFPVFSRSINPGGTVKKSLGDINIEINCGGVLVKPNDIVVGDRDGVVVISQQNAKQVLEKTIAIVASEKQVRQLIEQGKTTMEIFGFEQLVS